MGLGPLFHRLNEELKNTPITWVTLVALWGLMGYIFPKVVANTEAGDSFKAEIRQINLQLTRQTLLTAPEQYCKVTSPQAKRFIRVVMEEAQEKYFQLTNIAYRIPDCEEQSEEIP